jgi:hypothetical protein
VQLSDPDTVFLYCESQAESKTQLEMEGKDSVTFGMGRGLRAELDRLQRNRNPVSYDGQKVNPTTRRMMNG